MKAPVENFKVPANLSLWFHLPLLYSTGEASVWSTSNCIQIRVVIKMGNTPCNTEQLLFQGLIVIRCVIIQKCNFCLATGDSCIQPSHWSSESSWLLFMLAQLYLQVAVVVRSIFCRSLCQWLLRSALFKWSDRQRCSSSPHRRRAGT